MTSAPKAPPRFLPTLTEVVEPPPQNNSTVAPITMPAVTMESPMLVTQTEQDAAALNETVDQVTSRLQENLSIEIRSVATELVLQNSRELQTYVEREVMQRMQQMIEHAVRKELDKKNL
jgi:hypothetical protein